MAAEDLLKNNQFSKLLIKFWSLMKELNFKYYLQLFEAGKGSLKTFLNLLLEKDLFEQELILKKSIWLKQLI